MSVGTLDDLMNVIHASGGNASPEVLEEAKALRDKLRDAKHAAPEATGRTSSPETPVVPASPLSANPSPNPYPNPNPNPNANLEVLELVLQVLELLGDALVPGVGVGLGLGVRC